MRLRIVVAAIAVLSAGAFTAGSFYYRSHTNAPRELVWPSSPGASATTARSRDGLSFSISKTPKPLPELKFVNGEGREMTLKAFEGQTVLLNLWATWCIPCREEMPALERLQTKLGGPDFQVVALSIDREGLPAVRTFYRELGLKTLGIYVDQTGAAARQLGAVGIPTTLVVDRDGHEIGRIVGPAEWDSDTVVQALQRYMETSERMSPTTSEGEQ